jgi:hypothetical protein
MFWHSKKRREEEGEHARLFEKLWDKATDIQQHYTAFRSTEEEKHANHAYNLLGGKSRAAIQDSGSGLEETGEASIGILRVEFGKEDDISSRETDRKIQTSHTLLPLSERKKGKHATVADQIFDVQRQENMQSGLLDFGKKRATIQKSRYGLERGRPDIEILSAEFRKEDDISCSVTKFWKEAGERTYLIRMVG